MKPPFACQLTLNNNHDQLALNSQQESDYVNKKNNVVLYERLLQYLRYVVFATTC